MQFLRQCVLIVEDQKPIRDLLFRILSKDFQCHLAASAEEALELLVSTSFHLVLTDMTLPKMDGADLCRIIRQNYPATKVLLMSGASDQQAGREAVLAGACGFISKPFRFDELILQIRTALNGDVQKNVS